MEKITITKEQLMNISSDVIANFAMVGLKLANTEAEVAKVAALLEGITLTHAELIDRIFSEDFDTEEV